jgi:hypothetical protein
LVSASMIVLSLVVVAQVRVAAPRWCPLIGGVSVHGRGCRST